MADSTVDYGDQLHDRDPQSSTDPGQFVKDTKRWSYHLANDPYGGSAGAWAKQFYDNPNADPNSAIQNQISAFRSRYGDAAPDDDIGVMTMIAEGRAPEARAQSPTQSWTSQTTRNPGNEELLELLKQRARQATAIGRDDPNVRAQVDPFTAQMERASRNYLDDVAEGARGMPFNMEGERRMAAEKLGQQSGQFEGQVIGREIDARRREISEALQLWSGMLSDEQRLDLERELGYLNDATRNRGIDVGYDQFLRELALREWQSGNEDYYRRAGI